MIKIDGSKRHVYVKFTEDDSKDKIIQATGGQEYKYENVQIIPVTIEIAGLGIKMFRIPILLLVSKECAIRARLPKYGEVRGA